MQNRKQRKITGQTIVNQYQTLRQQTYKEGFKPLESGFGTESEEADSSEEDQDDLSSEEDLMMYDYDNKITQDIWLPQEPRLYVLFIGGKFLSYREKNWAEGEDESSDDGIIEDARTHSEMIELQNITNFTQKVLKARGIYLLDYDSEVFIWVGKDVPKEAQVKIPKQAARAIKAINPKGRYRMDNITVSITFQGYEPEVFKSAFKGTWEPFQRQGIDDATINESGSESSHDSEEESKNLE